MASSDRSHAVSRLLKEQRRLLASDLPQIIARPDPMNMLSWHFLFYDLPDDTPYKGGVYHGRLDFNKRYPYSPPRIQMLTPSGRFETNRPICFSMSDFHPELWNVLWGVETILKGMLSFMLDEAEETTGSIRTSDSERRRLAKLSFEENKTNSTYARIFPDYMVAPPTDKPK